MPFKVKEILLVATLYDAYSIEKEGRFSDHMLGQYHQLESFFPAQGNRSIQTLKKLLMNCRIKHYDMVIIMMGVDKQMP
jgi:hypothetical protein